MGLMELAREMGKKIQASEEYKNLYEAKEKNDNDEVLQDAIGKFNLKKIELNTAMASDQKDKEKIETINQELRTLYADIMKNENMAAFTNAKNAMDKMMNQVTNILMLCVNGEDPETCDPNPPSCGGSCSTCGGCH